MNDKIERLQKIFNRVFENCPPINMNTKKDDIASWDSINHLSLILECEAEFGLSFSVEEIENLKSVEQILKKIG